MRSFLPLLTLLTSATAHTIFMQIGINGVMQEKYKYLRLPTYDGPIENVNDQNMACNGGPNPLVKISNEVANVKAGDQITLVWAHTLDTDVANGGMVIDASHNGPIMVYMAKVPSATGPIPNSGWFKIYEDGFSNGQWAVQKLIANKGKVTVTIPSCLPDGDYLFRGELLALHSASRSGGAQFYMECAQLRLSGGGSASPQTYNIPGIYKASDPGVLYNLYTGSNAGYQIPGPRPFTCNGSGGGGNNGGGSTPTQPQQPPPVVVTPTPQQPPPSSGGNIPKYAQCGGQGWSGSGSCASGSTCVKQNDWYSQCL